MDVAITFVVTQIRTQIQGALDSIVSATIVTLRWPMTFPSFRLAYPHCFCLPAVDFLHRFLKFYKLSVIRALRASISTMCSINRYTMAPAPHYFRTATVNIWLALCRVWLTTSVVAPRAIASKCITLNLDSLGANVGSFQACLDDVVPVC